MSDTVNAFSRLIHVANKLATTTFLSPLKNRRPDVGATAAGAALMSAEAVVRPLNDF
jgi:hypothetical protein